MPANEFQPTPEQGGLPGPVVGGFAFWTYDLFPKWVGGEITRVTPVDDGKAPRFNVKGYGDGPGYAMSFTKHPDAVVFFEPGMGAAVKAEIERLHALRSRVEQEARRLLREEGRRVLPVSMHDRLAEPTS